MALLNISKYSCCTNIVQIVLPVKTETGEAGRTQDGYCF